MKGPLVNVHSKWTNTWKTLISQPFWLTIIPSNKSHSLIFTTKSNTSFSNQPFSTPSTNTI